MSADDWGHDRPGDCLRCGGDGSYIVRSVGWDDQRVKCIECGGTGDAPEPMQRGVGGYPNDVLRDAGRGHLAEP